MPIVKKRNEQTETRLLLESDEPVELPPAEIEDRDVLVQFEKFKQFIPELLEELRDGVLAEPVAVPESDWQPLMAQIKRLTDAQMHDARTIALSDKCRSNGRRLKHVERANDLGMCANRRFNEPINAGTGIVWKLYIFVLLDELPP